MDFSSFDIQGLQLLHTIAQQNEREFSEKLEQEQDMKSENALKLTEALVNSAAWAVSVMTEIQKRQQQSLKFSVEDIFRLAGQYDKFVSITFYRSSEAFRKYGELVNGTIFYGRKARAGLTEKIGGGSEKRTDGKVLMTVMDSQRKVNPVLKREGFNVSEVCTVSTFIHDANEVVYQKTGLKEIPNTITIPFDASDFDLPKMENLITSWKLRDSLPILEHEMRRYYTNELIMRRVVEQQFIIKYLYKSDQSGLQDEVWIQIYKYGHHYQLLEQAQTDHFNSLLKARGDRREKLLQADLGISAEAFKSFKKDFPEAHRICRGTLLTFEAETLLDQKSFPIYWDEERFIHIYGRHYVAYFTHLSTYQGTQFQYTYKDIRRLLCLVLESLREDIEINLTAGKKYNRYGDMGYYFNGDYFTLKIEESGRVMTFHPMSIPSVDPNLPHSIS